MLRPEGQELLGLDAVAGQIGMAEAEAVTDLLDNLGGGIAGQFPSAGQSEPQAAEAQPRQGAVHVVLGLHIAFLLALSHLEEGGPGNVDISRLHQGAEMAVEEGEHQGPDMGAVHIGVGHDDDAVVSCLGDIDVVPCPGADGGEEGADFQVAQEFFRGGLFGVDEFSPDGEDGLEGALPALLGGAAGGIPLHDVEFAEAGVLAGAVGEFSHQAHQGLLGIHDLLDGLAGLLPGQGGDHRVVHDARRNVRMLLEEPLQVLVGGALHQPPDLGIVQLGLGLAFEEGVLHLHRNHRRKPLPHILAGDGHLLVRGLLGGGLLALGVPRLLRALLRHLLLVVVDGHGEGRQEAHQVGPPVLGVDAIDEGVDGFLVGIVVLQGDVIEEIPRAVAPEIRHLPAEGDGIVAEDSLALVQIGDEFGDASLIMEGLAAGGVSPHIVECDADAGIEIGQFPEAFRQDFPLVFQHAEDFRVGEIVDGGAPPVALPQHLQLLHGLSPGEFHLVFVSVPADGQEEPLGEGIDAGDAHPVEPPGKLVDRLVELSPCMEHGQGHLTGGLVLRGMHPHGDSPPIVGDGDGVVHMDGDLDVAAISGQCLVDGVVHHLVDELVQSVHIGVPDIHSRALAYGFQALQDLDLAAVRSGDLGLLLW